MAEIQPKVHKPENIKISVRKARNQAVKFDGYSLSNVGKQKPPANRLSGIKKQPVEQSGSIFATIKKLILILYLIVLFTMIIMSGISYMVALQQGSQLCRVFCTIPYQPTNTTIAPMYCSYSFVGFFDWRKYLLLILGYPFGEFMDDKHFLQETEFYIADTEGLVDIHVYNYKDRRPGRFIHNYRSNISIIVDEQNKFCFYMRPGGVCDTISFMQYLIGIKNTATRIMDTADKADKMFQLTFDTRSNDVLPWPQIPGYDYEPVSRQACNGKQKFLLKNLQLLTEMEAGAAKIWKSGKFAEFLGGKIVKYDLMKCGD